MRRLRPTLVPRVRKALDGTTYGGTQPTNLSRINRRLYWPSLCPDSVSQKGPDHEEQQPTPHLTPEVISTLRFSGPATFILGIGLAYPSTPLDRQPCSLRGRSTASAG